MQNGTFTRRFLWIVPGNDEAVKRVAKLTEARPLGLVQQFNLDRR